MKITKRWLLAGTLATSLGATSGLAIQQEEAPAEQPAAAESSEPVTGLEFDGTLKAVDADQRFFLVTSAEGEELLFHYDDATEVVGQDSVQGLSGEGETMLHILYRAEGDRAIAERIEPSMTGGDGDQNAAPEEAQPPSEDPGV